MAPAEVFASGPDRAADRQALRRNMMGTAVARVLVVTAALLSLLVYNQLYPPVTVQGIQVWHYVLIGVTYGLSLAYMGLLPVSALLVPLAYAQVLLDGLVVSVLVFMTGGVQSVFTFAYVFCILVAATLMARVGALLAWLSSLVMFGGVLVLQLGRVLPVLPGVEPGPAIASYALHTLGMAAVAFLAGTLARKLQVTGESLAQKEEDLIQLEALHASILRALPAGLMTIDDRGVILYANRSAAVILRQPLEVLRGGQLKERLPVMTEAWQAHVDGEPLASDRQEVSYLRPDGRRVRLGFSFAPLNADPGRPASIAVFRDVTEMVRLRDAVERAERLASVGKFASGLAHEVRNPLASICASVDVLKTTLNPPGPMQRLMDNVIREADRLNALITDFLTLARPRKMELLRLDLSELVAEVLSVFSAEAQAEGVQVDRELQPAVDILGDASLLRQVLWNLLRNAKQAMGEGGRLRVELSQEGAEPRLRIQDNGAGIPPEQLAKVFDPFYTTKDGGTGLGLSISHSIMEAHGGRMDLESEVGQGTIVTLCFAVPSDSGPQPPAAAATQPGTTDPAGA